MPNCNWTNAPSVKQIKSSVHSIDNWCGTPQYILTFPVENFWEASSFEDFMINRLDPPANALGRKKKESP